MSAKTHPGTDAVTSKGWMAAHKRLLIRRTVQLTTLGLFLTGPLLDVWIIKGNPTSSLTLGVLPLSDPFILVQSLLAGHVAAASALIGAAIVLTIYALVGGRSYCSFVCPMNVVTDASRWLAKRLDLPKGWQPARRNPVVEFGHGPGDGLDHRGDGGGNAQSGYHLAAGFGLRQHLCMDGGVGELPVRVGGQPPRLVWPPMPHGGILWLDRFDQLDPSFGEKPHGVQ